MTDYLFDLQPGLSKVLAATTGANVDRFVHTPQGIHAQHDASNGWQWMIQDGLGSVRGVVDSSFDVDESRHYAPYGEPWGVQGSSQTDFGFTGEPTDGNGLVHLRARYLNPMLGVFPNLDPVEGALEQAMSLNRYGYVSGNVLNLADPSGNSPNCQSTTCPSNGHRTFVYSGLLAALKAIEISENGFPTNINGNPINIQVDVGFNSANFMSMALHAGGYPMTTTDGSGQNDICGISSIDKTGWCARPDPNGRITGNISWRTHNQNPVVAPNLPTDGLIGYISGNSSTVGQGIYGLGSTPEIVSVSDIFLNNGTTNPYIPTAILQVGAYQVSGLSGRLRSHMNTLNRFSVGDYIYTPTQATKPGGGSHGFLIVGRGPALTCNSPSLESNQNVGHAIVGGSFNPTRTPVNAASVNLNTISSGSIDIDIAPGVSVFYVADVTDVPTAQAASPGRYGLQRGTARPFYCSKFNDTDPHLGGGQFRSPDATFAHSHWYFYRVPRTITVACNRLYTSDPLRP